MSLEKRALLEQTTFGERVAEDERDALSDYFVETDQWRRLYGGRVDIVRGPKGSGKSAAYFLLLEREDDLFDRGIAVIAAENPRGAPAFQDLVADPPASELEFQRLWKLYLLSLVGDVLTDYEVDNDEARRVRAALADAGLRSEPKNLRQRLRSALDYVRRQGETGPVEALEGGLQIDPVSDLPALRARIAFREPTAEQRAHGIVSADNILADADAALGRSSLHVRILLDRLDVAFAETRELEANALRALFHVYRDFSSYSRLRLKIFLRDDIWERIIREGFREASHVTRDLSITWDEVSLLNLIIRRALSNAAMRDYYRVDRDAVLSSGPRQRALFYRLFPRQVEAGGRRSNALTWMLNRTRDGTGRTAPRELIHLLQAARDDQLSQLDVGQEEPEGEIMIGGSAIKSALDPVAKAGSNRPSTPSTTICGGAWMRSTGRSTEQTVVTLGRLWSVSDERAATHAQELADIGFFEPRNRGGRRSYWVPFLYRSPLNMVQGRAD